MRDGMSIEKHPVNGSYIISEVINGRRECRAYYGMTKKEAAKEFAQEFPRRKNILSK